MQVQVHEMSSLDSSRHAVLIRCVSNQHTFFVEICWWYELVNHRSKNFETLRKRLIAFIQSGLITIIICEIIKLTYCDMRCSLGYKLLTSDSHNCYELPQLWDSIVKRRKVMIVEWPVNNSFASLSKIRRQLLETLHQKSARLRVILEWERPRL